MKAKFRLVGQPTPHYPKGKKAIVSFEVPRTARRGGILLRNESSDEGKNQRNSEKRQLNPPLRLLLLPLIQEGKKI
jgi:hypothetical protein